VLVLLGGQGTGKSTATRVAQELIDPSIAGLQLLPTSPRELAIAAQNAHLLCFDNTRGMSAPMRSVPLNDSALEVLSQTGTEGKHAQVFVNAETGKAYTTVAKVWSRLRKEAGVPHLRLHDLRHGFASFLVNSGRTLFEVQALLGHADAKTTERYAHLSKKTLQDAANSASLKIKGASAGPT